MDIYKITSYIGEKAVESLCEGVVGYCGGLIAKTNPELFGLVFLVKSAVSLTFIDIANFALNKQNRKCEKVKIRCFVDVISAILSITALRYLKLIGDKGTLILAGLFVLGPLSHVHKYRKIETGSEQRPSG